MVCVLSQPSFIFNAIMTVVVATMGFLLVSPITE